MCIRVMCVYLSEYREGDVCVPVREGDVCVPVRVQRG